MNDNNEKHWEKYRQPKKQNSNFFCYIFGVCDLVCFVGGAYLLSLAIFSKCISEACSSCCGYLYFAGLPLIVLGLLIRNWSGRCCSSNSKYG